MAAPVLGDKVEVVLVAGGVVREVEVAVVDPAGVVAQAGNDF